jgi:ABC-2 type transport system ATP-binding protein
MTAQVILTRGLTRRYGVRRGVESLDLAVPEGSLFGFLGPNGAGKTTTIRVLMGLLRPTSGGAAVLGHDCWRRSRRIKSDIGYLPGDLRLPGWINGREAIGIAGQVRKRDISGPGRDLARQMDLDLAVRVRAMSRGMRQKLGLILALAHEPRVLILDEPSSGLDPLMQDWLRDHLRRLAAGGATVFFSSHSLAEVEALCDHVAIVREGRLVANQPLRSLQEQAGHEVWIRWRAGGGPLGTPPAALRLTAREAGQWAGSFTGPVGPLLEWLHTQPVEDVSIGRPDLETLFRRYYGSAGSAGGVAQEGAKGS